jgi:hypothetical protein
VFFSGRESRCQDSQSPVIIMYQSGASSATLSRSCRRISVDKKHVASRKRENDETPRMVESTLHQPSLYILIMATTTTEAEAYSNPVRLSVATRESNATAGPSTSTLTERERLLKARKSNEVVRRKGEKWADKLMEETVDRDTFKRAVSLSNP